MQTPQFPPQADQVQPGVPSDQRHQFGAAKEPNPTVTAQRQPLIQGKVGRGSSQGNI
jgi:hypothetical protein